MPAGCRHATGAPPSVAGLHWLRPSKPRLHDGSSGARHRPGRSSTGRGARRSLHGIERLSPSIDAGEVDLRPKGEETPMRLILIGLFAAFSTAVAVIGLKPGTTALRNAPEEFMPMPWAPASPKSARHSRTRCRSRVPIGRDSATAMTIPPRIVASTATARFCVGGAALGGTKIETTYSFRGGGLASLRMIFSSDSFDRIEKIFIEWYGPPSAPPRRGGRAIYQDQSLSPWEREHIKIVLRRYLNSSTRGAATPPPAVVGRGRGDPPGSPIGRRDAGKRPERGCRSSA